MNGKRQLSDPALANNVGFEAELVDELILGLDTMLAVVWVE